MGAILADARWPQQGGLRGESLGDIGDGGDLVASSLSPLSPKAPTRRHYFTEGPQSRRGDPSLDRPAYHKSVNCVAEQTCSSALDFPPTPHSLAGLSGTSVYPAGGAKSEAEKIEADRRTKKALRGRFANLLRVIPAAPASDAVMIRIRRRFLQVLNPLHDIAMHIVEAKGIGHFLSDWMMSIGAAKPRNHT